MCDFEAQVEVGMSLIDGAGYGLFARVSIKEGQVVCIYTGECRKGKIGHAGNRWVLGCEWYNPESNEVEHWYLDSYDDYNAAGRFANDARNTIYTNNCVYDARCSSNPHHTVGKYYVNIVATRDICKGDELLMSYGSEYWEMHEDTFKGKMHDRVTNV